METHVRTKPTYTLEVYRSDDIREWIGIFLHACRSRNLSVGTIDFYGKKLNVFIKYCEDIAVNNISQITSEIIRHFLILLEEQKHKPGGIHCHYRTVKTFLKWYEIEADLSDWKNPIDKVDAPIIPLEPLDPVSIDTIKSMIQACNRGDLTALRDKALLLFLLDTGVRLAEFLALNKQDINPVTGAIQIRCGKGRKPRNVYMGDKSRKLLRKYLKERDDFSPALWVSRTGERLTESGLRMILRRRAASGAVPVPSPHDFRRAFALERWRAGVDLLTLSKLMGHTSLQVLNRYIKQAGDDLEQAAKQSSPVDRNF